MNTWLSSTRAVERFPRSYLPWKIKIRPELLKYITQNKKISSHRLITLNPPRPPQHQRRRPLHHSQTAITERPNVKPTPTPTRRQHAHGSVSRGSLIPLAPSSSLLHQRSPNLSHGVKKAHVTSRYGLTAQSSRVTTTAPSLRYPPYVIAVWGAGGAAKERGGKGDIIIMGRNQPQNVT